MMRVLTVRQPFADYILQREGRKDVENRTVRVEPQRVAVHAGKLLWDGPESSGQAWRPRSAILGSVQIVECHRAGSAACDDAGCAGNPWAMMTSYSPRVGTAQGPRRMHHWVLAAPRLFAEPIPALGKLGIWTPDPALAAAITAADQAALAEATATR